MNCLARDWFYGFGSPNFRTRIQVRIRIYSQIPIQIEASLAKALKTRIHRDANEMHCFDSAASFEVSRVESTPFKSLHQQFMISADAGSEAAEYRW